MPSVHNPASETCKSCLHREDCRVRAVCALEKVRAVLKVDHLLLRLQPDYALGFVLSPVQLKLIEQTQDKLRGRLRNLLERQFDKFARAEFSRGTNPFTEKGAKHMRLAGEMLLRGGFTRASLRQQCIEHFGWTQGTALSEVSQAVSLLRGLQVTKEEGDRIVLAMDSQLVTTKVQG
jgi:hypothetical protein